MADLLVGQVEFRDVIRVSNTGLDNTEGLDRLKGVLRSLNSEARIISIRHGEVLLDQVLETGRFNFEKAQQAPGWLREMRGEHIPETEEYGTARHGFTGMFCKTVPEESWPQDPEYRQTIMASWEEPFGDMRQEQLLAGKTFWQTLNAPFPGMGIGAG